MVRSSSNFADRSLSSYPCDNELGVALQGRVVADFQQKLWRRYFGVPDHVPEVFLPEEAFTAMAGERGLVKRICFNKDNDTTRIPDVPVDLAMDLIHLGPWWGGKEKIEWKSVPASHANQ